MQNDDELFLLGNPTELYSSKMALLQLFRSIFSVKLRWNTANAGFKDYRPIMSQDSDLIF